MATDHFAEFQEARYEEDVIVEREAHEDGEGHGRDDIVDTGRLRQTRGDVFKEVLRGPRLSKNT